MEGIYPRLVIAALRGGAGKTTISTALAAAWRRKGKKVAPFKKGPDYIDAAWLSLAAERPCYNLDTFLLGREKVRRSFRQNAPPADFSLIEGNRGLYDGVDSKGSHSTAVLAKLLAAPVILVLDCSKMTRTAAALVYGCQKFDPALSLCGVILNQVAGSRHEAILRGSIQEACDLPVLGAVPRMEDFPFPQRHLGLTPPEEHLWVRQAIDQAIILAEKYLDLERLWGIGQNVPSSPVESWEEQDFSLRCGLEEPVIGVVKDSAFQFYYPENLQALAQRGAKIREISAIREKELPPVDALYIGGGFPETHAELLAGNVSFRNSLRQRVENGLPVYAECGGFMYLGESITIGEQHYPMVGALPVSFGMERRPQGHGYTVLEVEKENPFFPVGSLMRGHEFHYSRVLWLNEETTHFAYRVRRGVGIDGKRDGLCCKNILASYSHLHALGTEEWAEALVAKAVDFRRGGLSLPMAV